MNLDKSIYSEANISKKPALELLQAMGYTYLSPEECRQQRGSGYRCCCGMCYAVSCGN